MLFLEVPATNGALLLEIWDARVAEGVAAWESLGILHHFVAVFTGECLHIFRPRSPVKDRAHQLDVHREVFVNYCISVVLVNYTMQIELKNERFLILPRVRGVGGIVLSLAVVGRIGDEV